MLDSGSLAGPRAPGIARQLVEHARQLQQERAFGLAMERGRRLAAAFLGFVLVGLDTHTGSIDR
jgi:hypothetical protein